MGRTDPGALEPYRPPTPRDISGPGRYLLWLVRSQRARIAAGMALGSSWMVSLALPPFVLSQAIDRGLIPGDRQALLLWAGALLVVSVLIAVLAISRHRTMTRIRMDASFRTIRASVRQSARLGSTLSRRLDSGEVTAIGTGDVQVVSQALTVTGPGFGAVVAYACIAVIMFDISALLAVVVLAGVPLLAAFIGPLLRRIEQTTTGYRRLQGQLTGRLVDVIGGLRVLNGIGGKDAHLDRYRAQSRELVGKGFQVGRPASWVVALATGLPALFLAVVVWIAARMAATGEISIGDFVAVHGYVAVLVIPVGALIEGSGDIARALVSARQVIHLLRMEPEHRDTDPAAPVPAGPAALVEPESGVVVEPGLFTAVVSARPADAIAVVERLGRFRDTEATWGDVRVDGITVDAFRERVLVADNDADFFAGTVRTAVAGRREPEDSAIRTALRDAVADDVVEALPEGLDSKVVSGAATLSGGQKQRMRMARALYADPDVLLAVEPTSAVDAHTEAVMAERLAAARHGRTTVVTTTSPLVLDIADRVVLLVDGVVDRVGTHHELLSSCPAYREVVSRVTGQEQDEVESR
ncbi:ABC-type multidrug transport system fused ATPase/permease subunit [Saccharothrix tamanrassetensis]|uniref:ABC-type multidrug transport system fused ATPase/permease subunit n=1 Tax=Saccharothrix tamanrassetensis TaxID=1051531 RepID=A0A841CWB8_9PSEU|nr:ABC transporter ATP-binding protein [Saccharothrix tamanrassetensis]MBB5960594.1 ABC-type multidrug transport system fused ATPase/permease subunit [Saccharothrix tamanrassetensis]